MPSFSSFISYASSYPLPHASPLAVGAALAALLFLALMLFSMRTRYFYFVRHGESMLNKEHIKQAGGGSLSPKGRLQAEAIGHALTGLHIRRIISSPYQRAVETADIIARIIHARVSLSALFAERRSPSEIIGKPERDPEVQRIIDLVDRRYHPDDYRFSDEENFLDQRSRAQWCLRYLARRGGRATCVVTHHAFLKMLIATMLYPKELHASDFVKLSYFNYAEHGITVCSWSPWRSFGALKGWRVLVWDQEPPPVQ